MIYFARGDGNAQACWLCSRFDPVRSCSTLAGVSGERERIGYDDISPAWAMFRGLVQRPPRPGAGLPTNGYDTALAVARGASVV